MDYRNLPISFPGLFGDWKFTVSGKLLDVGNGVYWYGVLIALGLLLGLVLCTRRAPKYALNADTIYDAVLWMVPFGIIGARLYYIIFYFELFQKPDGSPDFAAMPRIWDGGLAIYGGLIAGMLTLFLFCRKRKIAFGALTDCIIPGVLLGQAIGRWGNFMNREAYGAVTDLPWRMRIWFSDASYTDVHPTFFYESLWNVIGLLLILFVLDRFCRTKGAHTLFYFLWYGIGRFWVEGLRSDSLYLFDLTLFGERIRVSQALSFLLVIASAVWLAILFVKKRKTPPEE